MKPNSNSPAATSRYSGLVADLSDQDSFQNLSKGKDADARLLLSAVHQLETARDELPRKKLSQSLNAFSRAELELAVRQQDFEDQQREIQLQLELDHLRMRSALKRETDLARTILQHGMSPNQSAHPLVFQPNPSLDKSFQPHGNAHRHDQQTVGNSLLQHSSAMGPPIHSPYTSMKRPRSTSGSSVSEDRKQRHRVVERKRTRKINLLMQHLKEEIQGVGNQYLQKSDKASILLSAIECIRDLRASAGMLGTGQVGQPLPPLPPKPLPLMPTMPFNTTTQSEDTTSLTIDFPKAFSSKTGTIVANTSPPAAKTDVVPIKPEPQSSNNLGSVKEKNKNATDTVVKKD